MILAGHQPEYLPYLGFFYKLTQCNKFVLLDHVQYQKEGFQNRNYIRARPGKLLLTVPLLKHPFSQQINEVLIDNKQPWARRHWKTIYFTYQRRPFFKEHEDFFKELYAKQWERLVDLNASIILYLMKCFGTEKEVLFSSQHNIAGQKTEMLIDLCEKLGADTYVSGWGAKAYVDVTKFREHNLTHRFVKFVHPTYQQHYEPFIPAISAIDLLFNYGPEAKTILSEARRLSSVENS
jgi:hypothetical protein